MATATHTFPRNFKWGTATAAHQVEGGNRNNQWWAWEQQPGRIVNNDTSGLACDWWRNAEGDFDRMAEMGLNAHRMSVEWSRIEPTEGRFDSYALDRYRAMLLGLRKRGIEPMVTLHHFTNPVWFEQQGGWTNREACVRLFARYVQRVVTALGDVCDLWCTINEPNVYAMQGWVSGSSPPGRTGDFDTAFGVVRNLLLGHAAAYHVLHNTARNARVGLAHHMRGFEPLRDGHLLDGATATYYDAAFNQGIVSSLANGVWPLVMRSGSSASAGVLRGTLDWIGLNYYTRERVKFDMRSRSSFYGQRILTPSAPTSDFAYSENYPRGMLKFLTRLSRLKIPIYITENGVPDAVDRMRPGFLMEHLKQLWLGIQFCYDIHGYYHWSFIDNFEWSEGWRMKFGLVAMDPHTQVRSLRESGMLYSDIVKSGSLTSAQAERYAPAEMPILFP